MTRDDVRWVLIPVLVFAALMCAGWLLLPARAGEDLWCAGWVLECAKTKALDECRHDARVLGCPEGRVP